MWGQMLTFASLRQVRLCRSCTERIHLYALRHTHITILLSAGVHPKLVAERSGHASVRMTLDVYSHVVPAMQCDVGSKLGKLLYGDET